MFFEEHGINLRRSFGSVDDFDLSTDAQLRPVFEVVDRVLFWQLEISFQFFQGTEANGDQLFFRADNFHAFWQTYGEDDADVLKTHCVAVVTDERFVTVGVQITGFGVLGESHTVEGSFFVQFLNHAGQQTFASVERPVFVETNRVGFWMTAQCYGELLTQ
ncbi:hypothetical protein D3C86_1476480 [compost metagenome]